MGELWLPRGRGVQSTGLDLSYSSWMSSKICKIWWAVSAVKVLHARLWGRSVGWHDCGVSHSGWVMGLIDTAVECHIQAGWWVWLTRLWNVTFRLGDGFHIWTTETTSNSYTQRRDSHFIRNYHQCQGSPAQVSHCFLSDASVQTEPTTNPEHLLSLHVIVL